MGRRLPGYNPEHDGPYETSKRRMQVMKRVYQNMEHWKAQQEDHGMSSVITTIDGEDIDYYDLMIGIDTLPLRQRQAFELICLQGYTESAATEILLPDSKWSTPVQQYSDDGLKKMIAAYDAKQAGTWDPVAAKKKRRSPTRKREDVPRTASPPEVPEDVAAFPEVPEDTAAPQSEPRNWDFTTWSEDHQSLAEYITEHGIEMTPAQVKAVSFLRKQWYEDPIQVQARKDRRLARHRERDKFADETPQQRKARHLAARKLRSAQLAERRLQNIQAEVRALREQAGLDPETGEPVAKPS